MHPRGPAGARKVGGRGDGSARAAAVVPAPADAAEQRVADDALGILVEAALEEPAQVLALGGVRRNRTQALATHAAEVEHGLVVAPHEAALGIAVGVVVGARLVVERVEL